MFQRRSYIRTTKRRPCTMTQMRMQIPDNPNLITASWCSTNPYGPPGASSVWSVRTHTSRKSCGSCHFALYTKHKLHNRTHTAHTVHSSWNASALKNAVISSLATVHIHPPTVSAFLERCNLFIRDHRSILSITRVGRETDSQPYPQEVLKELLGLTPLTWQSLNTRQAASMLKMLLCVT